MAKRLIQDIISAKKQIPKRIERPEEEKKSSFMRALEEKMQEEKMQREEKPKIETAFKLPRLKLSAFRFLRPALKLKLILGIIALGFLILGADILLNKFSSIDVEITPRQEFRISFTEPSGIRMERFRRMEFRLRQKSVA